MNAKKNSPTSGAVAPAKKYILAVDIVLTSPMTITALEKGSYDHASGRLMRYAAESGVACSLTRTLPLVGSARVSEENKRPVVPEVPVIPSSTLKHKLRSASAELLFDSLVEREQSVSPAAYNTMMSGMATTELKAEDAGAAVIRTARMDPFLGTFGGTSFALPSSIVVSEGWPILKITEEMLMTPAMAAPLPLEQLRDLTTAMAIVRKNPLADMAGRQLESVVGPQAIAEYMEREGAARAESKAAKAAKADGKKTDLRTLNAVEAVNPQTPFAIRVAVNARTPAHLGLLVRALQQFLRDGQVGGKASVGFGQFIATASRLIEVNAATGEHTGTHPLYGDKTLGYPTPEGGMVSDAVLAAQDYIDQADPRLFEAFAAADAKAVQALVVEA